ncbi:hypothetical protein [Paludisphaera rhizosphaerae]|uniref:hypothetical protein n=1 Tax=Paludisphaera rhizosphaerae TaxID=2711216 RepID=UPI0013EB147B|nr:hypothetical protein [Paludisphaera rhizosphaerae]
MGLEAIENRHAASTAALDVRCLNAYQRHQSFAKAARAVGVTLAFCRAAVERASQVETRAPAPTRLRLTRPEPAAVDDGVSPSEERGWVRDVFKYGMTLADVADAAGVTIDRVKRGVAAARARGVDLGDVRQWVPDAEPLFPIDSFTPQSTCPHHGPIASGWRVCCMVCHASGLDDRPELKISRRTVPRHAAAKDPTSEVRTNHKRAGTRRERRAAMKGGAV